MTQADKTLRDYQKELDAIEHDLHYYYSPQPDYGFDDDEEESEAEKKRELDRVAKGEKMGILIRSLRKECRLKFGDRSLWPGGECPAVSFKLGMMGGLSKAFHVWDESEYNKIEDLKSEIIDGGFFGPDIDEETGEKPEEGIK